MGRATTAADRPSIERPGFRCRVEWLTWDHCVLRIERGDVRVFQVHPAHEVWDLLDRVESGALDEVMTDAMARRHRRLRRPSTRRGRPLSIGVEHEYRVLRDGRAVDFAGLFPGLGLDAIVADPNDPNAHAGRWGGVITADGIEAEVATPPVEVSPDCRAALLDSVRRGRAELEAHLPDGLGLDGWSTHVNVSAPRRGDVRLARRFAETFAPGAVLLTERADSPGLLVRPRPGRLEVGSEFVDGDRLAAAALFVAAAVVTLVAHPRRARPLRVRVVTAPSRQRFGFHLPCDAFGDSLHDRGADAVLHTRSGPVRAGDHLERAWRVARPALASTVSGDELASVDRAVSRAAVATGPLRGGPAEVR